jgi:hypothetical protein
MGQYRYIVGWLVCNLPSFSLYSGSVALNRYIQAFLSQHPRNIIEAKTLSEAMDWFDLLDKKDGSHAFIWDKARESIYLWKTL